MDSHAEKHPLVRARNLKTWFPVRGGVFSTVRNYVKAVNGVDVEAGKGEIVSIVGESGCGKSTLGYSLLGLVKPTGGEISLDGLSVDMSAKSSWRPFRKDFQIIFQDPYTSLNPRHTVFEILSEPMLIHRVCGKNEVRERSVGLLEKVGLSPEYLDRYPHEFSGGQRQRIGIARAISLEPKLIVCDEVLSSLDVSVQAQILRLLMDLRREMGLSLVFISHDLSVVRAISDRVHVMYLGKIVETAAPDTLYLNPRHPYTKALLDAIPTTDTSGNNRPKVLEGEIPSPIDLPTGCSFAGRCSRAVDICGKEYPETSGDYGHSWTCHNPDF